MSAKKIRNLCSAIFSRCRVGYYRFMGITIGKNCYISSDAHIDVGRSKITIGNKV